MPSELLSIYPRSTGRYDELLDEGGHVRPHWQSLWRVLVDSRRAGMRRRIGALTRQIRDNSENYHVYSDPQGPVRPWEVNLLPLMLGADDWSIIEAGVAQRAELFNRVLGDLYGPQQLVSEGAIPTALVYRHGGFLHPCRELRPIDGIWLHVYAADLGRSPDGSWWVIGDRTQGPSGLGYALENRIITSRLFPYPFRQSAIEHLAEFFRLFRDALVARAPTLGEPARVVLLTPGPQDETYFEHAYLAHYLGLPLVESQDLTVRSGTVYLKTMLGLQRVHGIVSRLGDAVADPLELGGDSDLGVPGLLDAVRRQAVAMANVPGAGILEGGAWNGFLPGLSERLLGEPLRLPSVATWWLGQPAVLERAVAQLDRLFVRPAFPRMTEAGVFGGDLDAAARRALEDRVRASPEDYVAQELVKLGLAPVLDLEHARRLKGGVIVLRVFACATPVGYFVMPGALTRVSSEVDTRVLHLRQGGSGKDTWIPASGEVHSFSLLRPRIRQEDLVRSVNPPSREAENMYWFGRYTERCDITLRVLRASLGRVPDLPPESEVPPDGLARLRQELGLSFSLRSKRGRPAERSEKELLIAMVDRARAGSLAATFADVQRIAFHLRARLSPDQVRTLNRIGGRLTSWKPSAMPLASAFQLVDLLLPEFTAIAGFIMDGMTRDIGWRFLSMGRRLERVQFLCLAIRQALADGEDEALDWLLEVGDSVITYRSRYRTGAQALPVVDLLLREPHNPRSVIFLLSGLNGYLHQLPGERSEAIERAIEPLLLRLNGVDLEALLARQDRTRQLAALLTDIESTVVDLSERLTHRYFGHVDERHRRSLSM